MSSSELRAPHPATRWDVYRDPDGRPVTITYDQCDAIRHAARVWVEAIKSRVEVPPGYEVGYETMLFAAEALVGSLNTAALGKSRLMGRMLYDGKPPFDECPPMIGAAADYPLWERENEQAWNDRPHNWVFRQRLMDEAGLTGVVTSYSRNLLPEQSSYTVVWGGPEGASSMAIRELVGDDALYEAIERHEQAGQGGPT